MILFSAFFTQAAGTPAVALALADIDLYLWSRRKADAAEVQLWDGTQNPTEEVGTAGAYTRAYTGEDFITYDYFGMAEYTGAAVLDVDYVTGVIGLLPGLGAVTDIVQHTIIIVDNLANPIPDADVVVRGINDVTALVVASGRSDSNGRFRFWGDTGVTYYIWSQKDGIAFTNPTVFVVP